MKVCELPPEDQAKAVTNQILQGNKVNFDVDFENNAENGNFAWEESQEGFMYWYHTSEAARYHQMLL